ncbi:acyl-[ACP]--phospholipid O-acyltransferase [Arcobacter sp. CECT 8983]|uniref:acyl-[ACP]--phospholipid O-acyltransferase n=1 Tax=Arcobacter sp. CECT 8983 TaxID=2044508 RepID=UPI00100BE5D2|nr:acyl-[ACP]--phospholipid O-acyltransferase [Arcobacter sp. CECT 8983]RXJ91116.1 acyl-[ACP]--phospholipid O-acyltransferase [Arcobacter sp. CECT 8983]
MERLSSNLLIIKLSFLCVVFCNVIVDVAHKVLLQNIAFKIFDGSEQVVWISIINAMIIIPFLLLFTLSGYLSDKYNKKDILVYGAVSSFCLSVLMVFSYLSGSFYLAMLNLILLAIQSAIYSPAKFGLIINIWGKKNLAKGNASLQAVSIIAILFSLASGSFIFESFYNTNNLSLLSTKEDLLDAILPLTYYIVPVAFLEMLLSLIVLKRVKTIYVKNEELELNRKEFFQGKLLKRNIKTIFDNNIIFLSVVGLSVFWGVSQGLMAVFPSFAKEYLQIEDVFVINAVIASSGIGIAIGSIFYSKISKHYIEIGTIPLSAIGMTFMIYLSTEVSSVFLLGICFLVFGIFGGLFVVPLNSLIQFNAKKKNLGTILAGNNWFHSLAMFLMLCLTTFVSLNNLDPLNTIYLILLITIVGMFYTIFKLPQSLILLFMKFVVGLKYKLEVHGVKNIPSTGGVLLLGNHVSWIDWAVILMSSPRQIKFVMHKPIYEKWYLNWILRLFKAIPISNASSKDTIKTIAKELDLGNVVVLFPEGGITRNGHLGEFKRGFELILKQTKEDIPVIAFYIRGLWESLFSRANEKYKRSKRTNSVTVSFSKLIKKQNANAVFVKQIVKTLSTESWRMHTENMDTIPELVFDRLKQIKSNMIYADTTGVELSGYKFLTASILFKDLLKDKIKGENIGLLFPSSAGGAFFNTSVLMLGKTAVNLNFTASMNTLKLSVKNAEIKTIITSKKFIKKLKEKGIAIDEVLKTSQVLYVEDLKAQITKAKSLTTLLSVILLPTFILKNLHIKKQDKDSTAVILFSSGSEGIPKGIELSHKNVVGNCQQIAAIINVNEDDIFVGSLPFFHAFGTVVTLFMPIIEGIGCVAHPDPTDGFAIGKLVEKYKATIMLGTSTFFRLYTKNPKVQKKMFESLRLVVAGAEKLSQKVREDFKVKFDKEILEGYGVTETTPVACCNLPNVKTFDGVQIGNKIGSVGMPIPGTKIKIVNPKTNNELPVGEEGMILICGVQVMKGYLKDEKKTKEALITLNKETYYITGDKGRVDEDGFLTIVDRYSRFAKLGGEMISLGAVEQNIEKLITNEEIEFIATTKEDEKKGEKIILLISNIKEEELEKLKKDIIEKFDNNLMIPSLYKIVDEIPKLGSGKLDFKEAKKIVESL